MHRGLRELTQNPDDTHVSKSRKFCEYSFGMAALFWEEAGTLAHRRRAHGPATGTRAHGLVGTSAHGHTGPLHRNLTSTPWAQPQKPRQQTKGANDFLLDCFVQAGKPCWNTDFEEVEQARGFKNIVFCCIKTKERERERESRRVREG